MARGDEKRHRTRIVDVAERAGVSPQTVSNVINGRAGFTPATRKRVERAIAEMDFQPNRFAQSLRSQRTGLIGFDMAQHQLDISNPFTLSLLQGLVRAAERHGQRVLVFTHEEDKPEDFRATATAGLVDGFVLSDSTVGDPRVEVLDETEVPFVVLGRTADDDSHTWLDVDNAAAMRAPIDLLVDQGCREFAFVTYSGAQHWNRDRRRGAREALATHGLRLPRDRVVSGSTLNAIRRRLPELLTGPDRPDAVVTSSDSIAVLVLGVATSLGLRVGRDIALTGFDDGPLSTLVSPELTSVALPVDEMAERLMTLLSSRIAGDPHTGGHYVSTRLVVRESSGFAPAELVDVTRD